MIGALLGLRRRVGAAPRRAALDRPLPARRDRRRACSASPRASSRTPPGSSRRTWPRSSSATPTCPHRGGVRSFAEGTGLARPDRPVRAARAVRVAAAAGRRRACPRLVAGVVLLLAARPLSVVAAALPFRVPWREQAFLSWSGLRGAVPIVLALIALTRGRAGRAPPRRRRVRAGGRAHPAAGHHAAVGRPAARGRAGGRAARDRGRRRAAGRAGRRPAAGPRARRLPADGRVPARAAAARAAPS